jgi:hypothetical protein
VAFDGAGAVGDGKPGGDGGPVPAKFLAEAAQLSLTGLPSARLAQFPGARRGGGRACPRSRGPGQGWLNLGAAGGDLRERGAVAVREIAGRGEDPAGYLLRRWCWRSRGDGGVLAQPGGEPAQGARAAAVAAGAQFGV